MNLQVEGAQLALTFSLLMIKEWIVKTVNQKIALKVELSVIQLTRSQSISS